MDAKARSPRDGGVDTGRLVGAFLVIGLHCLPNPASSPPPTPSVLMAGTAARVAVPFFFVASGLFLPVARQPLAVTTRRTIGRLLPLHLSWLALYLAMFSTLLPSYPWTWKWSVLLTGGPGFQLWFLPALGASQWLVAMMVPRIGPVPAAGVAGGIAVAGLWLVYGFPPHVPFWLPRLAQGPILVLAGHAVARHGRRIGAGPAALACLFAYAAALGEDRLIAWIGGGPVTYQEFDLSTCLFGIAAALLARAPGLPSLPAHWRPARLSLLVYCVHVLFLWPLLSWIGTGPSGRVVALFAMVSALSLAFALGIDRLRRGRAAG